MAAALQIMFESATVRYKKGISLLFSNMTVKVNVAEDLLQLPTSALSS